VEPDTHLELSHAVGIMFMSCELRELTSWIISPWVLLAVCLGSWGFVSWFQGP